jgi:hypothetical protein
MTDLETTVPGPGAPDYDDGSAVVAPPVAPKAPASVPEPVEDVPVDTK